MQFECLTRGGAPNLRGPRKPGNLLATWAAGSAALWGCVMGIVTTDVPQPTQDRDGATPSAHV